MNYDIVIYGGGLGAYCSAMSASKTSPSKSICMIIPCPTAMVGGIATAGGQNFWDDRGWNGTVQQGTYTHNIKTLCAARYNTDTMSSALRTQLLNRGNITLKMQYDITSYTSANNPYRITSVQIKKHIQRWNRECRIWVKFGNHWWNCIYRCFRGWKACKSC